MTTDLKQLMQSFLIAEKNPSNTRLEILEKEAQKLTTQITQIRNKKFLPIESGDEKLKPVLLALQNSLYKTRDEINAEKKVQEGIVEHRAMAKAGYPDQLDLSFLGMTKFQERKLFGLLKRKYKVPAFIVVDVEDHGKTCDVTIDIGFSRHPLVRTNLPGKMHDAFKGAFSEIAKIPWIKPVWIELSAVYDGTMPDDTRDKIQKLLHKGLFDNIFIIAESPEWKINIQSFTSAKADPIVIGWSKKTQQVYIIDVYDPTDLEKYISEQWGIGVLPSNE